MLVTLYQIPIRGFKSPLPTFYASVTTASVFFPPWWAVSSCLCRSTGKLSPRPPMERQWKLFETPRSPSWCRCWGERLSVNRPAEWPPQCRSRTPAPRRTSPLSTSWPWPNSGCRPPRCQTSVRSCSQTGMFSPLSKALFVSVRQLKWVLNRISHTSKLTVTEAGSQVCLASVSTVSTSSSPPALPAASLTHPGASAPESFCWGAMRSSGWLAVFIFPVPRGLPLPRALVRDTAFLTKAAENLRKTDTEVACWCCFPLSRSPLSLSLFCFAHL